MSQEKRWICTGTCGAVLTPEEYEQSKKVCGTPGCDHEGHAFAEAEVCTVCGAVIAPGETHTH